MGRNIMITLNTASKLQTYIKWHVGKVHNIPQMKESLAYCVRLVNAYKKANKENNDYPVGIASLS